MGSCPALTSGLLLQAFLLFLATRAHAQYYEYGDIRLVGGSYQWEGRVEIYLSGLWGTITDSDWTNEDAVVVCCKLGHFKPGATAHSNAYFGEGSGPVHLDSVECSGMEYNLTDCETMNDGIAASHSLDVGVKCQPAYNNYREGSIRLVDGPYNWEGRVEIFLSGSWGAISDSSWTDDDANVVCRQLQHSSRHYGRAVPCCSSYGAGSGHILIRDVYCLGSESNITECTYNNVTVDLSHQYDVGVECHQGDEVKEGDIRLLEGSYLWQGRVEIFLSGVWGTMSDDGAYSEEARVICRQLGYNTYSQTYSCCARFGQGSGPIHLRYPSCTGLEYRLTDCEYSNNTEYDSHSEDFSVYCYIDGPQSGDVRLTSASYGRVDVFLLGEWQAVANSSGSWNKINSEVVCRELGYSLNNTYLFYPGYYIFYTDDERMDDVVCTGSEAKLTACENYIGITSSNTAVGMGCEWHSCYYGDVRLVGGETDAEGRVEICNNGKWETVCGKYWTETNTAIVCRHLGYSDTIGDSTYYSSDVFGRGTGPILMDFVNCTGSEPRLWPNYHVSGCLYFNHYYGCSHNDDIGVQCRPASCTDGQLRLIQHYLERSGRIEICSNQRWETLSYREWTYSNAWVACNELGFNGYYDYSDTYLNGGGPRHSKYYRCDQSEQRLSDCDNYTDTNIRYDAYDDVGMDCAPVYCDDGEVRLDEGETEWEGRLEMCYNERWSTIGSEGWTDINTQVVCNDLGYDVSDKEEGSNNIRQSLSKPVYLHNVKCSSSDLSLLECGFTRYTGNINDVQDAIVVCQKPTCMDGDVKLVGGTSNSDGRLEVCFDQRWTTVDGYGWTDSDTKVACRQLGYSTSDVSYTKIDRTPSQTLPVSMTLVGCYGSEERLIDCAYHDYTDDHDDSMDIRISCGSSQSSAAGLSSESTASLSIAVIIAIAFIILIAILIAMFILRRKKKKYTTRHEMSHHSTQDPDSPSRRYNIMDSGISHFNKTTEAVSLDEKIPQSQMEDVPMENYEEVQAPETNPIPIPPKPKPKKAPKKAHVTQNVGPVRYTQADVGKPAVAPPVMRSNRGQRQPQPPSDPPEAIYECPD